MTEEPETGLWKQRQAAEYLNVSVAWLRASSCPKVLVPGNGPKGQPIVRYDPAAVRAWALSHRTPGPPKEQGIAAKRP